MNASCQPLPRSVAEEMLQVVARALCDRAGDSPEQRTGRTRQMVLSTLGMAPRDGLEMMLATLVFGHFQVILDSMADVFRGQTDALKAKTRAAIVPLGRAMREMIRELREVQQRPTLLSPEDVQSADAGAAQPQQTEPQTPPAVEVPEPDPLALTEEELAALSDPRLGLPAEVIAWVAGTGPAVKKVVSMEPSVAGSGETQSAASPGDRSAGAGIPFDVVATAGASSLGSANVERPAWEDPSKSFEERAASYRETFAAVFETLAEAQGEIDKTKAASGD